MNQARRSKILAAWIGVCVFVSPSGAAAQDPVVQGTPGAQQVASDELAASKALRPGNVGTVIIEEPPAALWSHLVPELSVVTLTWIAVVVILVLTLQAKPLLCWRNFDGVILALTALLLPLRSKVGVLQGDLTGQTVQWWTYLLLSIIGLYWLVRGVKLLLSKTVPAMSPNVSPRAMIVLILAGLFVAGSFIVKAPLSPGSRDGLIGGIYTAETRKLPYGDAIDHDARSPLLYLLHAGAVRLIEPTYESSAEPAVMRWDDRADWLGDEAWETVDPTPARLVNALLFVLLFAGVAGIGHRHHSVAVGQVLIAILCFFPGVLECLARPEIMLPTTLLAWSIAFVTLPGIGGLLSVLLLVLAGLAWPWAWLALPVMLAYFFRRGWHALGATVGLLIGLAAILVGATTLVRPTLPRHDGALADAGVTPLYAVRLSDDGTVVVEHHRPEVTFAPWYKRWLWTPLLRSEETGLDMLATQPLVPNGVDATSIMCRDLVLTPEARKILQPDYRQALAQQSKVTQTWASLRTLLEATWKPAVRPERPITGAWELWSAAQPETGERLTATRRGGKVAVVLLALLVALLMIRGERGRPHQLIGGLLVVSAATLLISMTGAATNWVWLMPTVLAALAASAEGAATKPLTPSMGRLPPLDLGPAPRITVEK
jgi:hypothetical protein